MEIFVIPFLCPDCTQSLAINEGRVTCAACVTALGVVENGIIIFDGCADEHNFFEKQAIERLEVLYKDYDRAKFLDDLKKIHLWEMDERNKRVGIASKFWWEDHTGKIENKFILEVGCGVNYIVPYFLECGNHVAAFDICRESVEYSKSIIERIFSNIENISYAVADARKAKFSRSFDIVNISNVLHHIDDKVSVFRKMHDALKDDGKLIIVEPNYYYPPRWAIETDIFDPINVVKNYFVKNDLIEKGEKAVIFTDMIKQLQDAGFRIDVREKDKNYLGYFTVYWMGEGSTLSRVIFNLDKSLFSKILPRALAPFEYIIATKN